jgi:hypothetical protein
VGLGHQTVGTGTTGPLPGPAHHLGPLPHATLCQSLDRGRGPRGESRDPPARARGRGCGCCQWLVLHRPLGLHAKSRSLHGGSPQFEDQGSIPAHSPARKWSGTGCRAHSERRDWGVVEGVKGLTMFGKLEIPGKVPSSQPHELLPCPSGTTSVLGVSARGCWSWEWCWSRWWGLC